MALLDPVFRQYALGVQTLLEQHNAAGLTRDEIGLALEGSAPADPADLFAYHQRASRHANEEFDKVRKVCRALFDYGEEGWGFIWHRHVKGEIRWHLMAKVVNSFRTPIVGYYSAAQIAQSELKEFKTRTRSATRIEVSHFKALEGHARQLPAGPERVALLREVEERFNAVEIRCLRLAALNMDSGMTVSDFEQLANPRDRRLRIFAKQTRMYLDAQKKANKELLDLVQMYEAFKQILSKDPRELGEGAGKLDRAKP